MRRSSFGNPALNRLQNTVSRQGSSNNQYANGDVVNGEVYLNDNTTGATASYLGVGLKSLYFAILVVVVALLSATVLPMVLVQNTTAGIGVIIVAFAGMLVFGIICNFAKNVALWGSLYAVCEAVLIGLISLIYDFEFNGIVFIALISTLFAFASISLLYAVGLIRVTQRFRGYVLAGLIALLITQLVVFLLSLFMPSLANIYTSFGFWLQLGICAAGILLACCMIAVDLNNVTNLVQNKMPKKYEWNAAFGLVVTLIWLYLLILRILAILFSRRD